MGREEAMPFEVAGAGIERFCVEFTDGGDLCSRFGVLVVEVSMARGDGAFRLEATMTSSPSGTSDCFSALGCILSFITASAVQRNVDEVQVGGGDGGRLCEGGGSCCVKGLERSERKFWSRTCARTFTFIYIRWLVR